MNSWKDAFAWKNPVRLSCAEGEIVLLRCSAQSRRGVPFGVLVTDRKIRYERPVWFGRESTEIVTADVQHAERVQLRRRSPWPLWIAGGLLALVPLSVLAMFILRITPPQHVGWVLVSFAAPLLCFAKARSRFTLEWWERGRRHRILQPASYDRDVREEITLALKQAAQLLGQPGALGAAVARAHSDATANEAAVLSDGDERDLCPDGACTGLLGTDRCCKLCGAQG